ncbi:ImmA/IrrE family metallo-endopeptidase [Pandoraea sp. PE-S2R-1]|uniref:ImmA/IrrE family metallo-endopeptidase n=1 Tax=Pandoraea sp. PE-S2R-1 TaxID=1986994 RepID=UPI000B3FFA55|nr:ImmA/IrrE family metallo-endopeptidase [Pandoraea sp. PE-S2R-1]
MTQGAEKRPYVMRGNRVVHRSAVEIADSAKTFCRLFHVGGKTRLHFAEFIESLALRSICVDPIADSEWLLFTDAICEPGTFTILLPESTYIKACHGDEAAISTICHEIGHLMLGHKAVLHNEKSAVPSQGEDAEWQADAFADYLLSRMGFPSIRQLTLDFDGE